MFVLFWCGGWVFGSVSGKKGLVWSCVCVQSGVCQRGGVFSGVVLV